MPKRATIKVTNNAKAVRDDIRRRKLALAAQIDRRARELNPQAQGMLILGLNATVYQTERGQYARTTDLAQGAHATVKRVRRGVVEVRAWNTVPYAALVEYGTYGDHVEEAAAVARTSAPGAQPSPLVTGRSGVNYTQPSLAHTRAVLWPLLRLRLDVKAAWYRAWK